MTISFNCDSCGREIKVRDEQAGRNGSCPGCGNRVRVPDDDVYDVQSQDDDYADDDYEDEVDDSRKPCRACGEMIKKNAAVCRFCGETFDGRARKKKGGGTDIDDDMTTGDWVVAIICSGIGCIAGIVWMIQGKKKGPKMLGISLVMAVIWNVIRFAIAAANNPGQF